MNNYDSIPQYWWYTTKERVEGQIRTHHFKGKVYVGYMDEPEPKVLDRYKLTFVAIGDMTIIGGWLNG